MLSQKTVRRKLKKEEFKIDPKNYQKGNFSKNDHNSWKALQLMCL